MILMNNEERIGKTLKEAVVAYLKLLYWHLPGEAEENYGLIKASHSPVRDLNSETPEYEAAVLRTVLRRSDFPYFNTGINYYL
jgi:hypothetical protein